MNATKTLPAVGPFQDYREYRRRERCRKNPKAAGCKSIVVDVGRKPGNRRALLVTPDPEYMDRMNRWLGVW